MVCGSVVCAHMLISIWGFYCVDMNATAAAAMSACWCVHVGVIVHHVSVVHAW
jgi:hypothetical protein